MSERSAQHDTFVIERTFEATPARVFKAFADPVAKARWFSATNNEWAEELREFDFRVGGKWRFDHELKRGPVIPFNGVYRAIEPVTRIVNTFGVEGMFDGAGVEETSLFEAKGETTLYRQIMRFEDFATRDGMLSSGMEKGARESMAQLDALIAELKETAQ